MAVEGERDRLGFQEDLHRLCDWADENQMAFNAKKCETVIFQKSESKVQAHYTLHNTPLEVVPHFKYLGVDISNDFRWDRHIDAIAGKGSQKLGMIRRTLHSAPKRVKLMAYLTLQTCFGVCVSGMGSVPGRTHRAA